MGGRPGQQCALWGCSAPYTGLAHSSGGSRPQPSSAPPLQPSPSTGLPFFLCSRRSSFPYSAPLFSCLSLHRRTSRSVFSRTSAPPLRIQPCALCPDPLQQHAGRFIIGILGHKLAPESFGENGLVEAGLNCENPSIVAGARIILMLISSKVALRIAHAYK